MKIDDLGGLKKALLLPESRLRPHAAENFAEHLKAAQAESAPRATVAPAGPLTPLTSVELVPPHSLAVKSLQAMEDGLARLEQYQRRLESAEVSLKHLAPLAAALEENSRSLQSLAAQLPADSPLRPLAEELAALAWVENFKFQRGDYL